MSKKVGEFKVRLVASELLKKGEVAGVGRPEASPTASPERMSLVLPAVERLLADPSTAVLAAWFLFDPAARALGRRQSARRLLRHVLNNCYDGEGDRTAKHLKLYHRTFLQVLIVRFGAATFLKYFSTCLVEAVGGYKDFEDPEDRQAARRRGLERSWRASEEGAAGGGDGQSRPSSRLSMEQEASRGSGGKDTPEDLTFAEGEVFAFDGAGDEDGGTASSFGPPANSARSAGGPGGEEEEEEEEEEVYITPPLSHDPAEALDEQEAEAEGSARAGGGNISRVAGESVLWLAHRCGRR